MWQTKYASAVPKNLGVGLDFRLCSEDDFLTRRLQSVSEIISVLLSREITFILVTMLNSTPFDIEKRMILFMQSIFFQVKASVFAECDSCNECMEDFPCEECQYWPIYPCYSATKPMVDCLAVYDNDAIAVSVEDPDTYNSATYM